MKLLPAPQVLTPGRGQFCLGVGTELILTDTEPRALLYAQMLQQTIEAETGLALPIRRGAARAGEIALRIDSALPADHYTLAVAPEGVTLRAGGDEALCNGVQTLCQLFMRDGGRISAQTIEDWPSLAARGYYLDTARGRVPTLETLKRYADLLCRYKINQWQLYIEHTYLFRDLSEAWRDDTPLTAQEILALDEYCAARHIELVPSLSSFGHMYKILSTKTCCDLCELPDSEKIPHSYTYAGEHHTLNVSNEGAIPFILTLIDEYRQLFRSTKFNICADETFDLGKGKSKPLAEKEGEQALYIRHVRALCEHLVAVGCTPMFWGDIVWRFPDACKELPPETICLNWGYLPTQREHEMQCIAETGAKQYACPGVCGWNCWMPMVENSYKNIRLMASYAAKYQALGLLNTDWGDYGHINDPRLSVPGILYGAAFSWNAASKDLPFEELNEAISFLEYGDASESLVGAMAALSMHEVFDWRHTVLWIEGDEKKRAALLAEVDFTQAPAANAAVSEAVDGAFAAARAMPRDKKHILQPLCLAGEAVILWNEIGAHLAAGKTPAQGGAELAIRLENWLHRYQLSWREVSKESNLPRLTNLICRYADVLRGREIR